MPILFSAVSRGTLVLAQCASCVGNFTEVTEQILKKIPPHDEKLTYSSANYLFHYIAENKLVYFCITDDKFPRSKAFSFLNEIKKKFLAAFGDTPPIALSYAAMNHPPTEDAFARVLETEMTLYSDTKISLPEIKAELEVLKSIMVQNVDKTALRGERVESLLHRTEGLATTSSTYRSSAVRVQRKYWWQYVKFYIMLVLVAVLMVYFIGAMACGGLAWQTCVR